MNTIISYIDGFEDLVMCLNKADVNGAKKFLAKLPKRPTVSTWQAYQLVSRAVAKFHRSASALEDLQYKFYLRCNLNDIDQDIISEHFQLNSQGKLAAIEKARELKRLKKENDKKQEEVTNNVF